MSAMEDSAGTLSSSYQEYMDGITAHTQQFQASLDQLATTTFDNESIKGLVDAGTLLINVLNGIIDIFGVFPVAIAGIGIAKLIKDFEQLKILGLQGATSMDAVIVATQGMTLENTKAALVLSKLEAEEVADILVKKGLTQAEADEAAATIISARADNTAAASTVAYTSATGGLTTALKGLWTTMKANPILLVIAAVTAAISLFSTIKDKIEESRQAAIDAGKTVTDTSSQLNTLIDSYKQLASKGINDVKSRQQAAKIQSDITDLVGAQAANLDLVNGKLDTELGKLKDINAEVVDIATLQSAYENAKNNTKDKSKVDLKSPLDFSGNGHDIKVRTEVMENLSKEKRDLVKDIFKESIGNKGEIQDESEWWQFHVDFTNLAEEDYKSRLEIYNTIIENLRKNGFNDDDRLYSEFLSQKNNLQELYNQQTEAANNLISGLVQNKYYSQETDVSSMEEYLALRNKMINEIRSEGSVQDMLADNSISAEDIEKRVDTYLSGLGEYSDYYEEWYSKFGSDIAKTTNDVKETLLLNNVFSEAKSQAEYDAKSTIAKDIESWYDGLTNKDREIVYKIKMEREGETDNWSLDKWKEEIANWKPSESEKISFSDLIKDDGFKTKIDDYKDSITDLDDTLDDLRSGDLSEDDKIALFEKFPQLASQADDLDSAIVSLIEDFESDAIEDFNEQLDYMDTDDDVTALNNLKDSLLGLAKTKNGVSTLSDELSKLKTILDDVSDTYSDMKTIIDDYNENGYLTLDNLQSIMDMEPEYINLLMDENGQINLNSQAYKNYVIAKTKALLVNELQDLYSSVLGMKVEEAQAYANAKAYNEETRSVQDLLTATTQLYYAKAMAKDSANHTTAYTDAMKRSFSTAANYASMVDEYINSLSTSQNEFSTSTSETTSALEAQKEALESQKDALEDYKDGLEDAKDALEDYKDGLEDAQSKLQSLIDLTSDYIKQKKNDEKDALNDQIDALNDQKDALDDEKDAYADVIDKRKEALRLAKEEREEADKLADKQKAVAKDALALAVANLDDSSAGRKSQKVAADNLAESNKDLEDYLYEQSYDKQIAALEEEQERFEETIERRKELIDEQVAKIEAAIDEIEDYLDNERKIYEDACEMIDNDNGELYGNLWNYTYTYTTKTRAEFDKLWSDAQAAIQAYQGDNESLISVMENLQQKIYDTDSEISDLNTQIDECSDQIDILDTAISNTSDAINSTSGAIDNVSSSLGGLASNISAYKAALDALAQTNDDSGVPSNAKWTFEYADNNGNIRTAWTTSSDFETAVRDIQGVIERETGYYRPDVYGGIKKHYASGTYSSAGGLSITQEDALEAIFGKLRNGQYTLLNEGSHVFNGDATQNLHEFADNPARFLAQYQNYGGYLAKNYGNTESGIRSVTSGSHRVYGDINFNPAPIYIQGKVDDTTLGKLDKQEKRRYEVFKKQFMAEMLKEQRQ